MPAPIWAGFLKSVIALYWKYVIAYLVIINLIGFIAMGVDKRRAVRHYQRTPEKTLFLIALIGGSFGSILGMQVFRHKTKHKSFVFGMPVILILQVALIVYLFLKGII